MKKEGTVGKTCSVCAMAALSVVLAAPASQAQVARSSATVSGQASHDMEHMAQVLVRSQLQQAMMLRPEARAGGSISLQLRIDPSGKIAGVKVLQRRGSEAFENAVLEELVHYHFSKSGREAEQPFPASVVVEVTVPRVEPVKWTEHSYSEAYIARVQAWIRSNIDAADTVAGAWTTVIIVCEPGGVVTKTTIEASSGSSSWEKAVLRAVDRMGTVPRDVDGRVPRAIRVTLEAR